MKEWWVYSAGVVQYRRSCDKDQIVATQSDCIEESSLGYREESDIVSHGVIEPTGVEVCVSIRWQRLIAYEQEVCWKRQQPKSVRSDSSIQSLRTIK